jgi:uncharacterized protein YbjT (DUF2867 family)
MTNVTRRHTVEPRNSPILVTGGTGRLGHLVVRRLRDTGRDVRVLSRRPHEAADGIEFVTGDLARGQGMEAAVEGTEVIVFCAGSRTGEELLIRNLLRVASRAGTRHLVYISVVGADRVPLTSRADRTMFAYVASKLEAEQAVAGSGLPWTTLRATPFYDALSLVARLMAKLPVIPIAAGFQFQPVDTREVADRLVELALGEPAGLVPEMGGPRVYGMAELLRGYLRARGKRRMMLPVRLPGKAARAFRSGAALVAHDAHEPTIGRRTWEDFLAEQVASTSNTSVVRG